MPDQRKHRGPHPLDRQLFAEEAVPGLREAVADLSWLWSRGYAIDSSLKLVGDRYALNARQRIAIARCACSDSAVGRRGRHEVSPSDLSGNELWIDGYNVLTSVEAALSQGAILHSRDGCFRDMASMHGSYRRVEETVAAIEIVGEATASLSVASCRWLFDKPVSNSGRLKTLLGKLAEEHHWNWDIDLVVDPDPLLADTDRIVASADSQILDKAERWFNLARFAIESRVPDAWIVDLS